MDAQIQEESLKDEGFEHFTSEGTMKVEESPEKVIRIFRYSCAIQSLILSSVLPWNEETTTGREFSCMCAGLWIRHWRGDGWNEGQLVD